MGGRLRLALGGALVALLVGPVGFLAQASPTSAASRTSGAPPASLCETHTFLCADTSRHKNYEGDYTGHDEPAISFHSNLPGSGNQSKYSLILPRDSAAAPTQNGTGGTWNFQLHPAFWFSMVMCDPQSSPEFTHAPCQPDSDKNIFDNPDPNSPDWIGHHPGSAFMEMQFYPPGWSSWPAGVSCTATKWCAALNIDSLNFNDLTGVDNNRRLPREGLGRAGQLRLHHQVGPRARAGGPARQRGQQGARTELLDRHGDELRRPHHARHARHAGRVPGLAARRDQRQRTGR